MTQSQLLLEADRFYVERLQGLFDGHPSQTKDVIRHPGAVVILPILDDGRICLIRNYRPSVSQTLIELPAGTREQAESPLATAQRELLEETGFLAEEFQLLSTFYVSPGILDEQMHLFVARHLSLKQPSREPGEQIENFIVSRKEALTMARDGSIQDAKTLIGLLLFDQQG